MSRNLEHISHRKKLILLFAFVMIIIGTAHMTSAPVKVQAATTTTGTKTVGSATYYYRNGKKLKNKWIKIDGKWYFFKASTGAMAKSEFVTASDNYTYYFDKNGHRVRGWMELGGKTYYFDQAKGRMQTGFVTVDGKKYYIRKSDGVLVKSKIFHIGSSYYRAGTSGALWTGWKVKGTKKYYFTADGAYKNGFYTIGGETYHMNASSYCDTGKVKIGSSYYYFIKNGDRMGVMLKDGTYKINSNYYKFDSNGVLLGKVTQQNIGITAPSSERTIKNFLLGSLQPVGSTLYVWGGGHNDTDATRIGISPIWKTYYDSQSGSYDYNNSRYQTTKGLDCSGFVGWSMYQVLSNASGGTNYTTLAEDVASSGAQKGLGDLWDQTKLSRSNYKFVAGDLACTSGHTWIVIGQCSDGSVVLVHATPPCLQISGTPTPGGSYNSKAIALAQKYMKQYYGSTVSKFSLKSTASEFYIKGCNVMRWNSDTLSDPDGYRNKTAAQILADLFATK